ncbi:hypothetical protein PRK78_002128 [Emydomyces testavorans]|uniref:Kinetochore protein fta4 n=1 Tax=Emydomyces testavorans TaxID=2070801 RepID=A0AAF0IG61_9EURO|nr:hypothetical protein PRK78_002128 [Emydomyces testavorans]
MDHSMTIAEIKLSFLRDQIRILSAALDPSEDWRDYGPEVEADIPDKVIDSVLQKSVNLVFGQHNRSVFSTQATHHVSQQIERLYMNSIDPGLGENSSQGLMVEHGTDLTTHENIERLPDEWLEKDVSAVNLERYKLLREQLDSLSTERNKQRQRLVQYKQLKTLLEPFNAPQTNIQPNLVTKDSQLAAELDRMRMLLAKLAARIKQVGQQQHNVSIAKPTAQDIDTKLAKILEMT